ncbi:protein GLUTAMINE DUMPER 2-like [Curcuma longa]|uniref:protein GLUTAMINE DUMPER 2-like n=1 Tax=Curcuma longa TaxID=136217 RepID=UPI003D9F4BFA
MRTGAGFNADDQAALLSSPGGAAAHSGWRYPVPFLFGGMAAMLALVALALLILTCSYYWNSLSGHDDSDLQKPRDSHGAKAPASLEDSVLVIMPGEVAPSVLAVPIAAPNRVDQPRSCQVTSPGDRQTPPQSH